MTGLQRVSRFDTTPTTVYAALDLNGVQRRPPNNGFIGDCNHSFFQRIDTESKAYFVSGLAADENVSTRNEISLSLKASDERLVRVFRDTLQIGNEVRFDERMKVFGEYRFLYRRAVVTVSSSQLAADLARNGVIPAKTGRTVPALIPGQVPRKLERHYWRGWVDMDNWIFPDLTDLSGDRENRRQLVLA